jgi:hypothetical protein
MTQYVRWSAQVNGLVLESDLSRTSLSVDKPRPKGTKV